MNDDSHNQQAGTQNLALSIYRPFVPKELKLRDELRASLTDCLTTLTLLFHSACDAISRADLKDFSARDFELPKSTSETPRERRERIYGERALTQKRSLEREAGRILSPKEAFAALRKKGEKFVPENLSTWCRYLRWGNNYERRDNFEANALRIHQ